MGKKLVCLGLPGLAVAVVLGLVVSRKRAEPAVNAAAARVTGTVSLESRAGIMRRSGAVMLRVLSSYTTRRIENEYVPVTAQGTYVIMDVSASNDTSHALPLRPALVTLDVGGVEHSLDASALTALELAGHRALATTSLRPDETTVGWVVFDVPPHALRATASLHLGLGAHAP